MRDMTEPPKIIDQFKLIKLVHGIGNYAEGKACLDCGGIHQRAVIVKIMLPAVIAADTTPAMIRLC